MFQFIKCIYKYKYALETNIYIYLNELKLNNKNKKTPVAMVLSCEEQ